MFSTTRKILYKFFGTQFNKDSFSGVSEVLCPAEVQEVKPAVFFPSHLERVKSACDFTSLNYQFKLINATSITHDPTVLYHLGSAKIYKEIITLENMKYISRFNEKLIEPVEYEEMDEALISFSDFGRIYFGHWLRDDLTVSLLGNRQRPLVKLYKPRYFHSNGYAVLTEYNQHFIKEAGVKKLSVVFDYSQNSLKVARYLAIRKLIETKLNPEAIKYVGVYLSRGRSGSERNLVNEDAVINYLLSIGFNVINPELMEVEDIVRSLWNAPIVISVEGSAINHALYPMALNGAVLVLQPPYRFVNAHKGIANAIGRKYGFYVCQATANKMGFVLDDFNRFQQLIDQLLD